MNINNKVIWITGASSGIGKGLALELSKRNCKLILSARRQDVLENVKNASHNSENIFILPFDLGTIEDMPKVVEKALTFFGRIDILINNGGISQRSLIAETNIEVDRQLMEVDYLGTVALSKAILPYFIKQQSGHYVTVTSVMGKFGSPYRSGYCGAKHALHGFFDVIRMEHEKDHIKVTLICPGFVNTDVAKNALTGEASGKLGTTTTSTGSSSSKTSTGDDDNKKSQFVDKSTIRKNGAISTRSTFIITRFSNIYL